MIFRIRGFQSIKTLIISSGIGVKIKHSWNLKPGPPRHLFFSDLQKKIKKNESTIQAPFVTCVTWHHEPFREMLTRFRTKHFCVNRSRRHDFDSIGYCKLLPTLLANNSHLCQMRCNDPAWFFQTHHYQRFVCLLIVWLVSLIVLVD